MEQPFQLEAIRHWRRMEAEYFWIVKSTELDTGSSPSFSKTPFWIGRPVRSNLFVYTCARTHAHAHTHPYEKLWNGEAKQLQNTEKWKMWKGVPSVTPWTKIKQSHLKKKWYTRLQRRDEETTEEMVCEHLSPKKGAKRNPQIIIKIKPDWKKHKEEQALWKTQEDRRMPKMRRVNTVKRK